MNMISSTLAILCVFFCQTGVIAQYGTSLSVVEDLQEEYYTTITTITYQILPQDDTDAQAITDGKKGEAIIAAIFAVRPKIRRYVINEQMVAKSEDKKTPWIPDNYLPQDKKNSKPFTDLCFGMVKDELTVIGNYLGSFLGAKQQAFVTIAMVLCKDIESMMKTLDNHYAIKDGFKVLIESQESPYRNMLKVWAAKNRETLETDELNPDFVKKDAQYLTDEQNNGGWQEDRDMLEMILMKKSIKYSREVIKIFEQNNNGKLIEDIIIANSHNSGLDVNLADAYASLALYIKNKYAYIANILRKYSDGTDFWAVWIMCIAVVHPDEWPKVETAFKKYQAGDCLSKFILQKNTEDKIMAELMAVIVDSTYVPTTFTITPAPGGPPGQCGTPPPVPPTTPGPCGTPPTVAPTTPSPVPPTTPPPAPPTTPGPCGTPPPVSPTTSGPSGTPPPVAPTTVAS